MILFLGLLLALTAPLQAQETGNILQTIDWSVRGNLIFFPENNGNASAPMPILPSLGGGASYPLNDLLAVELSLDLYGTTYDYDYVLQRAIPANDEFRSAFVTGAILGIQPVVRLRPTGTYTIRAYGGIGFDLRIIFPAYGIKDDDDHFNNGTGYTGHTIGEARKEISSYFWGSGRFIFPFIGGGMDFPVLDNIQLGFDLRAWLPIWRIWSGEDLSSLDSFRFGIGFRLTFK